MQEGNVTQVSVAPRPWKTKLKRGAVWTVAGLAALGAAYGAGRLQTSQKIDAAREETAGVTRAKQATEQTLTEERSKVHRLEARRQVHLALLALEKRNFGIAQEHLERAAKLLAGHVSGELESVRASLASFKLLATEDLEAQRGRLLEVTRRFDAALPAPAQ